MNFTKITNPLDKELTLQFKGEHYTIGAGETKSFPADVVAQWVFIYGFMKEAKETVKEVKEAKETKVTKK